MREHRTRTFRSGNSQAIRIPKALAFEDGQELIVVRVGPMMKIYPAPIEPLATLADRLAAIPYNGPIETRDTEELPEPEGL